MTLASPDLNPTEQAWGILGHTFKKKRHSRANSGTVGDRFAPRMTTIPFGFPLAASSAAEKKGCSSHLL